MKKTTRDMFMDSLTAIHSEGIITKTDLMNSQDLYDNFGIALDEFCRFALLSNTSKNTKGEIIPGNRCKVDSIEVSSIVEKDDVIQECAMRIIQKLDYILCRPTPEAMYNYCFTTINNRVTDIVKKATGKTEPNCVSLDEDLSKSNDSDKDYTPLDKIADNRYNPVTICEERETLVELRKALVEKHAKRRKAILHDTALLSKRPAEAFVWLAINYLNMKPRELTYKILNNGFYKTISEIIDDITKDARIDRKSIIRFVSNPNTHLTSKAVKIYTQDKEIIAEEISRIVYRAKKHLK